MKFVKAILTFLICLLLTKPAWSNFNYELIEEDIFSSITSLDKMYQVGHFRIFYTLKGKHALEQRKQNDTDKNNIPDYVENVMLQITVADNLFMNVLGLRHPLQSQKYLNKNVQHIDVFLIKFPDLNIDGQDDDFDLSGLAINQVRVNPITKDNYKTPTKSFFIFINNSLDNDGSNVTSAHELFHLFQFGYTDFTNLWFLEGMTRWVTNIFDLGPLPIEAFSSDEQAKQKLFKKSYDASLFWNSLCATLNTKGEKIPSHLRNQYYIGIRDRLIPSDIVLDDLVKERVTHRVNKFRVIFEERFQCAFFAKQILEELDRLDDQYSDVEKMRWQSKEGVEKTNSVIFNAIAKIFNNLLRN